MDFTFLKSKGFHRINLSTLNRQAGFWLRPALLLFVLLVFLLLPLWVNTYLQFEYLSLRSLLKTSVLSLLFFATPIFLFHRNLKIYFYLLSLLALITPIIVFLIIWMDIKPNFQLIALLMQTNPTEMAEVAESMNGLHAGIAVLFILAYLFCTYKLPPIRLPFRRALLISGLAIALWAYESYKMLNYQHGRFFEHVNRYYPASLVSGIAEAYQYMNRNNLDASRNFSFGAYRADSLPQRQIYVLVIGESSNYSHWQLNGYERETSPRLSQRDQLIVFPDAVAGSYLTWVSVPQIITRAHPDNMELQFREKSILSAFSEAGYKTAWLSNQSDQDIFWSGTINLHAKTADFACFSPTKTPYMDSELVFDERLLPQLDSLLSSGSEDLFIIMHTMGNHWIYTNRYPEDFDRFHPSGYTQQINPPLREYEQAIINTYDNSIYYADYILDSIIRILEKQEAVSSLLFLADHGEDFFESGSEYAQFHFYPTEGSLHIPFFIWTSESYAQFRPEQRSSLLANRSKKISTRQAFYTLLDMARVYYPDFDPSLSLAHPSFRERPRKFYEYYGSKSVRYRDVLEPAQ